MSRVLHLSRGVYQEPLLWPLGAAVLLLFLVPSALTALLPLAVIGLIGLRRPALAVMIIPVTFPFHDVASPAAHLHLDRTALLIGVTLLATLGHVAPLLGCWAVRDFAADLYGIGGSDRRSFRRLADVLARLTVRRSPSAACQ